MLVLRDWLKDYCGDATPSTKEIEDLLTFHTFEIEETKVVGEYEVIDVKVLPDRAGDCLSHRGIARELATLTGVPLTHDPLAGGAELVPTTNELSVSIENEMNCRRFALALVKGVAIKDSPEWLRSRLEALGQRSINNVVDATNYVMLALGQPLHAYDAKRFTRNETGWHFGVRMAREGEEVTTLSGDTYTLTPLVQLITNATTDNAVGVAGIKGGKSAEIDESTTDIILEAANFNPQITRKASQYLKLQTDASKRFENNLSPEVVPYALIECARLIEKIAGGVCEGYVDVYPTPQQKVEVSVTLVQVQSLLGVMLTEATVEDILTRLGFSYTKNETGWIVVPPRERTDVTIPEDVIAEVGRVYGYEHVASVVPDTVPLTEYSARHYYGEKVRDVLVGRGFSEVITSSFRKKDEIELANALASDKGCLRSTLRANICEVLDRNMPNADLLGLRDIKVFEIGTVFERATEGKDVREHIALAIGVRTKQQGYVEKDDVLLKETVDALNEALQIEVVGVTEKGVFECDLTQAIASLPVPQEYTVYTKPQPVIFAPYSTFPFVSRDIALWTPEGTSAEDVESRIRTAAGDLLTRVTLFDEFKKEGRVSYAFRLIFQSYEKTLTDVEVGERMKAVCDALTGAAWEIR